MIKRMVIMLIIVVLILGGVFGFLALKKKFIAQFLAHRASQPQTISTTKVGSQSWQAKLEAVGTLRAVHGTAVAPQVAGIVDAIHFKSGQEVQAGDLLVQLRDDVEVAKLKSMQAHAKLARITYHRDQAQYKVRAISKARLDNDREALSSANALVKQQQALVDYKTIRAPFSGRLGLRKVDLGQYLQPGTPIVTLQQLDPILIDFHLPQQALAKVKVGQAIAINTDTYPGTHFAGKITAINPKVNIQSRNVQIRARLKNPDHKLLPGMYATVDISVGTPTQFLTLPQTAITYNPYGSIVYLVKQEMVKGKKQLIAEQQFVKTGKKRGDQIQVLSGLKKGDVVVTTGQVKLHNHSIVNVNNSIQPSDAAHPTPQER